MDRSTVESGTAWEPKSIPAPPPPPKPYQPMSADAAGKLKELEDEIKILAGDIARLTKRIVDLEKADKRKV